MYEVVYGQHISTYHSGFSVFVVFLSQVQLGKRKTAESSPLIPPQVLTTVTSSSWSSGTESEGDGPVKLPQSSTSSSRDVGNPLPTLPSEKLPSDAQITFSPPLPALTVLPPLPELGKIMEDSDDEFP